MKDWAIPDKNQSYSLQERYSILRTFTRLLETELEEVEKDYESLELRLARIETAVKGMEDFFRTWKTPRLSSAFSRIRYQLSEPASGLTASRRFRQSARNIVQQLIENAVEETIPFDVEKKITQAIERKVMAKIYRQKRKMSSHENALHFLMVRNGSVYFLLPGKETSEAFPAAPLRPLFGDLNPFEDYIPESEKTEISLEQSGETSRYHVSEILGKMTISNSLLRKKIHYLTTESNNHFPYIHYQDRRYYIDNFSLLRFETEKT